MQLWTKIVTEMMEASLWMYGLTLAGICVLALGLGMLFNRLFKRED